MLSIVPRYTALRSPASLTVIHLFSAYAIRMIALARNTEMLEDAQYPSVAKPKLMMREGRHVSMEDTKIIMTKSLSFLFPTTKN